MRNCTSARRLGRSGARGAVIVETVVALVPVLVVFFTIAQFCALGYVSLLVKHAAFAGARAAAVVRPGMKDSAVDGDSDVEEAVRMVLGTTGGTFVVNSTSVPRMSQEMITTTVTLHYPCNVPLGGVTACGSSREKTLTASASFPNQGSYMQALWSLNARK